MSPFASINRDAACFFAILLSACAPSDITVDESRDDEEETGRSASAIRGDTASVFPFAASEAEFAPVRAHLDAVPVNNWNYNNICIPISPTKLMAAGEHKIVCHLRAHPNFALLIAQNRAVAATKHGHKSQADENREVANEKAKLAEIRAKTSALGHPIDVAPAMNAILAVPCYEPNSLRVDRTSDPKCWAMVQPWFSPDEFVHWHMYLNGGRYPVLSLDEAMTSAHFSDASMFTACRALRAHRNLARDARFAVYDVQGFVAIRGPHAGRFVLADPLGWTAPGHPLHGTASDNILIDGYVTDMNKVIVAHCHPAEKRWKASFDSALTAKQWPSAKQLVTDMEPALADLVTIERMTKLIKELPSGDVETRRWLADLLARRLTATAEPERTTQFRKLMAAHVGHEFLESPEYIPAPKDVYTALLLNRADVAEKLLVGRNVDLPAPPSAIPAAISSETLLRLVNLLGTNRTEQRLRVADEWLRRLCAETDDTARAIGFQHAIEAHLGARILARADFTIRMADIGGALMARAVETARRLLSDATVRPGNPSLAKAPLPAVITMNLLIDLYASDLASSSDAKSFLLKLIVRLLNQSAPSDDSRVTILRELLNRKLLDDLISAPGYESRPSDVTDALLKGDIMLATILRPSAIKPRSLGLNSMIAMWPNIPVEGRDLFVDIFIEQLNFADTATTVCAALTAKEVTKLSLLQTLLAHPKLKPRPECAEAIVNSRANVHATLGARTLERWGLTNYFVGFVKVEATDMARLRSERSSDGRKRLTLAKFSVPCGPFRSRIMLDGVAISNSEGVTVQQLTLQKFCGNIAITFAKFSPDGTQVVTIAKDNSVRIWDVRTGNVVAKLLRVKRPRYADISSDGRRVLVTGGNTFVWDTADANSSTKGITHHLETQDAVLGLFNKTGTEAFVLDQHGVIALNASTWRTRWRSSWTTSVPASAQYSEDGTRIAIAADKSAVLLNSESGSAIRKMLHTTPVRTVAFSKDGQHLVTTTDDGSQRTWLAHDAH